MFDSCGKELVFVDGFLTCELEKGHRSSHQAAGTRWDDERTCLASSSGVSCQLTAGHQGEHIAFDGRVHVWEDGPFSPDEVMVSAAWDALHDLRNETAQVMYEVGSVKSIGVKSINIVRGERLPVYPVNAVAKTATQRQVAFTANPFTNHPVLSLRALREYVRGGVPSEVHDHALQAVLALVKAVRGEEEAQVVADVLGIREEK